MITRFRDRYGAHIDLIIQTWIFFHFALNFMRTDGVIYIPSFVCIDHGPLRSVKMRTRS